MNIVEISEKFPRELDAILYFEQHRWGEKPVCPYCNSTNCSTRTKDFRFKCYDCTKTFSVTVHTHLHDTRLPLKKWLFAFSIVSDAKKGISAMQLQRNLSVSYPTAFKMYHTIRGIMAEENSCEVEGRAGQGASPASKLYRKEKALAEEPAAAPTDRSPRLKKRQPVSRIHIPHPEPPSTAAVRTIKAGDGPAAELSLALKDISDEKLVAMIERAVFEDESIFLPDGHSSCRQIHSIIDRVVISHKKLCCNKGLSTNTVESFWTAIKRQIAGQHHHISAKYLPGYVAETVFKFLNRREDEMFVRLVSQSMETSRIGRIF